MMSPILQGGWSLQELFLRPVNATFLLVLEKTNSACISPFFLPEVERESSDTEVGGMS